MVPFEQLWRPSCTITVGPVVFTDINTPAGIRGPRMSFRVQKTMTTRPDQAEFVIYNLDPALEKSAAAVFAERGVLPVTISAGYLGVTVPIFRGSLRSMKTRERSMADFAFHGWCDDGGDAFANVTLQASTAGLTAQGMITLALAALAAGNPADGADPYPVALHPSVGATLATVQPQATVSVFNTVHVGKATDLLDQAARTLNARWWIADNLLYMSKFGVPIDGLAIVVDSRKWLTDPQEDGSGLVRLDTFFDPNIIPGRPINTVPGLKKYQLGLVPTAYRCEAVEHSGDTRAGPWRSAMRLRKAGV